MNAKPDRGAEDLLKIALVDDNTDFLLLLRKKVHTFFDGKNVLCEVRLFPNPEVFILIWKKDFNMISVFWTSKCHK